MIFCLNIPKTSLSSHDKHGEVIALLGIAHEIVNGLRHAFYQGLRRELTSLNGTVHLLRIRSSPNNFPPALVASVRPSV